MQELYIRQFKLIDLERIYEIECASFEYPWAKADFAYYYLSADGFFVAVMNNFIVGFIVAEIPFPSTGHILNLAVDPKYRRLGIGSSLVNHVTKWFKGKGVKKMWLEVRVSNIGARAFYKKLGFKEERILRNYYYTEDAILMVKEI
ncbi:MAG: ribosomal protein S18-alanine N-acetyltransferase [Methanocellales archaeon]